MVSPDRLREDASALSGLRLRQKGACWFTQTKLARGERSLVSLNLARWNQIGKWLRRVEALRYAA